MNFKKIGLALLTVLALGVIAANSALAANEYSESGGALFAGPSKSQWPEGSTVGITTSVATEKLTLESTVGGESLNITATGVTCTSCLIKNVGENAIAEGTLKFTGAKLNSPQSGLCSVATEITTNKLKGTIGMRKGSTTIATIKFAPAEGTIFATVEILGGSCPVAGFYKITGTAYARVANPTGVYANIQQVELGKAIQESAGEVSSLKFGENNAFLTGEINLTGSLEYMVKGLEGEWKEPGGAWYTGASPGTKLTEGTTKSLTTTAVGTQSLQTTVAGMGLRITATGVNCISCVIKNVGTAATVEGTLEFTGAAVSEPTSCTVTSPITTKPFRAVVGMNKAGTLATLRITGKGELTLALVELKGTLCPISGVYKVFSIAFAQASNATGTFSSTQEVFLSKAITESAGYATALRFGENPAIPSGGVRASIGGTQFSAKEK